MDIKIDVTIGLTEDVKTFLTSIAYGKTSLPAETTKRSHHAPKAETAKAPEPAVVEEIPVDSEECAEGLNPKQVDKLKKIAVDFAHADPGNKAKIKEFLNSHKTTRVTELNKENAKAFIEMTKEAAADDNDI